MIDFNLHSGKPVENNEVQLILQQIELLFDTNRGEVLGDIGYGTSYSDFLFNLQASNSDIKRTIMNDLSTLELFGYEYDVNVNLLMGTENDIILVQIAFQKDDNYFEFPFKITR